MVLALARLNCIASILALVPALGAANAVNGSKTSPYIGQGDCQVGSASMKKPNDGTLWHRLNVDRINDDIGNAIGENPQGKCLCSSGEGGGEDFWCDPAGMGVIRTTEGCGLNTDMEEGKAEKYDQGTCLWYCDCAASSCCWRKDMVLLDGVVSSSLPFFVDQTVAIGVGVVLLIPVSIMGACVYVHTKNNEQRLPLDRE